MKTTTTSLLLLTLLVSACKTNLVYINVTNPAPVTISNLTTKVGLINRSIPSADNTAFNTLHQKRAGESLELIKEASAQRSAACKASSSAHWHTTQPTYSVASGRYTCYTNYARFV
jgi:uncharacterized membrane protein